MTTVTISGHLTTTWVADQSDTNYILAQGSSVTVNTGAPALDADGYAENRSFQIDGILDGGVGEGAWLGDPETHTGGGHFTVGVNGVVQSHDTAIRSFGAGQVIDNEGTIQSGNLAVEISGDHTSMENSGKIEAGLMAVEVRGVGSVLENTGMINAGAKHGAAVLLYDEHSRFFNEGSVVGGEVGVVAYGDHSTIVNRSEIDGKIAVALLDPRFHNVIRDETVPIHTLINSGNLVGSQLAVKGSLAREIVKNTGSIQGDIRLSGGDDLFKSHGGQVQGVVSGGKGDDTYVVDDATLQLSESAKHGHDTVKASVSFTLADNFETLQLTGKANLTGIGSDGNNNIVGNEGKNVLAGGLGDDVLTGHGGADVFVFKTGDERDTITDADLSGKHHDVIDLIRDDIDSFAELKHHMSQHGDNVVIDFGGGDKLILDHVDIHDLSGKDFDF
jgi:Ca2+-binding RTX toxin-like protein